MSEGNGKNGKNGKAKRNGKPHKQRGSGPPPPPKEYQFKPGQSGNPGGRPKGARSIVRELQKLVNNGHDGKDIALLLAAVAVKRAAAGDHKFWESIVDRIDGKVTQQLDARISSAAKAVPEDVLKDLLNGARLTADKPGNSGG